MAFTHTFIGVVLCHILIDPRAASVNLDSRSNAAEYPAGPYKTTMVSRVHKGRQRRCSSAKNCACSIVGYTRASNVSGSADPVGNTCAYARYKITENARREFVARKPSRPPGNPKSKRST